MKRAFFAATLVASLLSASIGFADEPMKRGTAPDTTQSVSLTGAVKRPGEISPSTLKAMPEVTVSISQQTDKGPITATFKGALLWSVIDNAGWANGAEKNSYLRHTILVTGKDGYAAALSEGEIDPKLEGKQVILAYEKDGVPLDTPRLVVPGDVHASRGVHDVVAIDVK